MRNTAYEEKQYKDKFFLQELAHELVRNQLENIIA